jgi:hypothetical protein
MKTLPYPPEQLDPPELSYSEQNRLDEEDEARAQKYADLVAEAYRGVGPFWEGGTLGFPAYDGEQDIAIFRAVRLAMATPGRTDDQRWGMVRRAVSIEAGKMATDRAEE